MINQININIFYRNDITKSKIDLLSMYCIVVIFKNTHTTFKQNFTQMISTTVLANE